LQPQRIAFMAPCAKLIAFALDERNSDDSVAIPILLK
jgi:hypothetical protein